MITASMSAGAAGPQSRSDRQADWELDFYSRPILEKNGKKRWELLIISTPEISTRAASEAPNMLLMFRSEMCAQMIDTPEP